MAAPAHRKIALAAALFGFPAAEGFFAPDKRAPQSWELSFATQAGAGPMFLGLFQSSRGGRDWSLASAPRVEWSFDCSTPRSKRALAGQLAAVKQCLTVRGGRPTAVKLHCDASSATAAALWALPAGLGGAGTGVSELTVIATDQAPSISVAEFVGAALPDVFPNVTTFTLVGYACPLPAPAHGPAPTLLLRLTAVVVACHNILTEYELQLFLISLAPYLPQLHSLHLSANREIEWGWLFSPGSTSQTLQRLSTSGILTDNLLSLLLTHAPALRQLSVGGLDADKWDYSGQRWGVEQLDIGREGGYEEAWLETIMCLPQSTAEGRVVLRSYYKEVTFTLSAEGLSPRLGEFACDIAFIHLVPHSDLPTANDRQALLAALQQLQQLQTAAGTVTVQLERLQWTAAMAEAVAAGAPLLPHIKLWVCIDGPLTDGLLGTLVQMRRHVRRVSVGSLAMRLDKSYLAWPWERLSIMRGPVDMASLLNLPNPTTGPGSPMVCLSGQWQVPSSMETATRLMDWLAYVYLDGPPAQGSTPYTHRFELVHTDNAAPLSTRLRVLQSVNLAPNTADNTKLTLSHLNMTTETITALSYLPSWLGVLEFTNATWPENDPAAYQSMATTIPVSYAEWVLGGVAAPMLQCLVAALDQHRHGLGLERLVLRGGDGESWETEHVEVCYVGRRRRATVQQMNEAYGDES